MPLNSLIIDDEPLAHKVILEYCKDVPYLNIVGQCYLASEALDFMGKERVDVIFLDIQMPKISGIEFLKSLKTKPIVIVTSAFKEYALEGFELDVCDYLLKPFSLSRFLIATNRALDIFQHKPESPSSLESRAKDTNLSSRQIVIKSNSRLLHLQLDDIYCFESLGNYVKVWVKDKFHLTARTLSSFEEELSSYHFVRSHKSFMINHEKIEYLEGSMIVLTNKQIIPVGKLYRKKFKY